jgi:hypothetical protein
MFGSRPATLGRPAGGAGEVPKERAAVRGRSSFPAYALRRATNVMADDTRNIYL